ncbi:MAG TPA: DUF2505 domain-containing protein [Solimonas sp.]|nr:DUF2505 domain-containing protein [Solimonas sp.]
MKYEEKLDYDQSIDTVMRMYSDRSYFERKYKDSGAWDVQVLEHEKSDRYFRIKCRFAMKSDAPLPEFARKFIGDSINVIQQDSWDLQKLTGRIETEIKGAPVRIQADMFLKPGSGGCANHLQWSVSCMIPLIGGRLEKVVAEDLQAKSRTDLEVSRKILRDY